MFERAWAQNILSRTMERLRADQDGERFRRLEQFITGAPADTSYRRIGDDLVISEAAVKTAIHRLRKRFGELLRLEVGETVQDSRLVDEEIRHLLQILSD
jgi:RNA polymerase sigma-70 factor (ECF subfamily)